MLWGVVVAVLTGGFIAAMGPINAALSERVGAWGMVSLVHLVGLLTAALGLLLFAARGRPVAGGPESRYLLWSAAALLAAALVWLLVGGSLRTAPPYGLVGGVLGVLVVVGTVAAIQRLGVFTALTLVVSSQLVAALLIDGFGWFGQAVVPVTPLRLVGLLSVLIGVALVLRG